MKINNLILIIFLKKFKELTKPCYIPITRHWSFFLLLMQFVHPGFFTALWSLSFKTCISIFVIKSSRWLPRYINYYFVVIHKKFCEVRQNNIRQTSYFSINEKSKINTARSSNFFNKKSIRSDWKDLYSWRWSISGGAAHLFDEKLVFGKGNGVGCRRNFLIRANI